MATTGTVQDADVPVRLEANGVECTECGTTYKGDEAMAVQNDEGDICPADDTHLGTPVHITREPAGIGNDRDYLIGGGPDAGTYVYPLEV